MELKQCQNSPQILCNRASSFALVLSIHYRGRLRLQREVVYQIITDRFFDGSTANNNPSQSADCMTRPNKLAAILGRRFAGHSAKLSYLAGMGVTAIWIRRRSII